MVLTRPVTKTKISTVDFGIPVYDWIVANTPTAWTPVSFVNGWVNEGVTQTCQYRKIGDMVYVRGACKNGSGGSICLMPVGLRALTHIRIGCFAMDPASGNVTVARFDVSGDGYISVLNIPAFTYTVFLNVAYSLTL